MNPFHPVFILLAVMLLGSAIPAGSAQKKGLGGLPGIVSADGLQIPFFCSLTGDRFAKLTVEAIEPARKRVGPFMIASPGYNVRRPRLLIESYECAPEDWQQLLSTIEPRDGIDIRGGMDLRLPDGSTFFGARLHGIHGTSVSLEIEETRILSLVHDGTRIFYHLRPKPTVTKNRQQR